MPPIAPGDSYTYVWDQQDNDGKPVAPGDYVVETFCDTIGFKINDSSSQESPGNGGGRLKLPMPMRPITFE